MHVIDRIWTFQHDPETAQAFGDWFAQRGIPVRLVPTGLFISMGVSFIERGMSFLIRWGRYVEVLNPSDELRCEDDFRMERQYGNELHAFPFAQPAFSDQFPGIRIQPGSRPRLKQTYRVLQGQIAQARF